MNKTFERPVRLESAPLNFSPVNEQGVIFLFAVLKDKYGFSIEKIQTGYPDCIAYRRIGGKEKRVRIEFEYKSSHFRTHGHDPNKCDCIVC